MWKPQKTMSSTAILTWERWINSESCTPKREITLAYLKENSAVGTLYRNYMSMVHSRQTPQNHRTTISKQTFGGVFVSTGRYSDTHRGDADRCPTRAARPPPTDMRTVTPAPSPHSAGAAGHTVPRPPPSFWGVKVKVLQLSVFSFTNLRNIFYFGWRDFWCCWSRFYFLPVNHRSTPVNSTMNKIAFSLIK